MTRPSELAAEHARKYEKASHAQTTLARQYLNNEPPDLSLAATACHRALQFERQAEVLAELSRYLQPMNQAGLHAALTELLEPSRDTFPWLSAETLRALLAEHPA